MSVSLLSSVPKYWLYNLLVSATNIWMASMKRKGSVICEEPLFIWGASRTSTESSSERMPPDFHGCYGLDQMFSPLSVMLL